jgi:hypothetical protein
MPLDSAGLDFRDLAYSGRRAILRCKARHGKSIRRIDSNYRHSDPPGIPVPSASRRNTAGVECSPVAIPICAEYA